MVFVNGDFNPLRCGCGVTHVPPLRKAKPQVSEIEKL